MAVGGLQVRLLGVQLGGLALALATMAVLAHWSITRNVRHYAEREQAAMSAVARQLAESTGQHVVVADGRGGVLSEMSPPPSPFESDGAIYVQLSPPPDSARQPGGPVPVPPLGGSAPIDTEQML